MLPGTAPSSSSFGSAGSQQQRRHRTRESRRPSSAPTGFKPHPPGAQQQATDLLLLPSPRSASPRRPLSPREHLMQQVSSSSLLAAQEDDGDDYEEHFENDKSPLPFGGRFGDVVPSSFVDDDEHPIDECDELVEQQENRSDRVETEDGQQNRFSPKVLADLSSLMIGRLDVYQQQQQQQQPDSSSGGGGNGEQQQAQQEGQQHQVEEPSPIRRRTVGSARSSKRSVASVTSASGTATATGTAPSAAVLLAARGKLLEGDESLISPQAYQNNDSETIQKADGGGGGAGAGKDGAGAAPQSSIMEVKNNTMISEVSDDFMSGRDRPSADYPDDEECSRSSSSSSSNSNASIARHETEAASSPRNAVGGVESGKSPAGGGSPSARSSCEDPSGAAASGLDGSSQARRDCHLSRDSAEEEDETSTGSNVSLDPTEEAALNPANAFLDIIQQTDHELASELDQAIKYADLKPETLTALGQYIDAISGRQRMMAATADSANNNTAVAASVGKRVRQSKKGKAYPKIVKAASSTDEDTATMVEIDLDPEILHLLGQYIDTINANPPTWDDDVAATNNDDTSRFAHWERGSQEAPSICSLEDSNEGGILAVTYSSVSDRTSSSIRSLPPAAAAIARALRDDAARRRTEKRDPPTIGCEGSGDERGGCGADPPIKLTPSEEAGRSGAVEVEKNPRKVAVTGSALSSFAASVLPSSPSSHPDPELHPLPKRDLTGEPNVQKPEKQQQVPSFSESESAGGDSEPVLQNEIEEQTGAHPESSTAAQSHPNEELAADAFVPPQPAEASTATATATASFSSSVESFLDKVIDSVAPESVEERSSNNAKKLPLPEVNGNTGHVAEELVEQTTASFHESGNFVVPQNTASSTNSVDELEQSNQMPAGKEVTDDTEDHAKCEEKARTETVKNQASDTEDCSSDESQQAETTSAGGDPCGKVGSAESTTRCVPPRDDGKREKELISSANYKDTQECAEKETLSPVCHDAATPRCAHVANDKGQEEEKKEQEEPPEGLAIGQSPTTKKVWKIICNSMERKQKKKKVENNTFESFVAQFELAFPFFDGKQPAAVDCARLQVQSRRKNIPVSMTNGLLEQLQALKDREIQLGLHPPRAPIQALQMSQDAKLRQEALLRRLLEVKEAEQRRNVLIYSTAMSADANEAVEIDMSESFKFSARDYSDSDENDEEDKWWVAAAKLTKVVEESRRSDDFADPAAETSEDERKSEPSFEVLLGTETGNSTAASQTGTSADTSHKNSESLNSRSLEEDITGFWENRKKRGLVRRPPRRLAALHPNSFSMTDNERSVTDRSYCTGTSASSVSTLRHMADCDEQLWVRRREMAQFNAGASGWLSGGKITFSSIRYPRPIDAVATTSFFERPAFMSRRRNPGTRQWKQPYKPRTKQHPGYFDVDVHSLYSSIEYRQRSHPLDREPWEWRDVKQRFLHEQSISYNRNWFGTTKKVYGNSLVRHVPCCPKSMEMPMKAGEWTREWYMKPWATPSPGASISTNATHKEIQKIRSHYGLDDSDDENASWEETPECGTFKNVKLKPGERITRLTPELTSSLRRSRWRKKHFPKGTFPY